MPIAAGVFGFATFAISVGLPLVNPTTIGWLLYGGDPEVHFLGWHLFRRGPTMNPAGATPLWMWPIGTSVGLTDSIPVFAFLFKILAPAHEDFQYQGLWLLCCFVLQGVFAGLLMRKVTPREDLQLLGACLLVMSPPMLHRYIHEALAAHWIVLWALLLSLTDRPRPSFSAWLIVLTLAAAIHPYIAMMVAALMTAAHARDVIAMPSHWIAAGSRFAMLSACAAAVLWQCGYFVTRSASLQSEKFGHFSMNLLSPFVPAAAYASADGWFRPATDGQYEGSIYLGAGLMLLLGIALIRWRSLLLYISANRAHAPAFLPLMCVIVGLFLLLLFGLQGIF